MGTLVCALERTGFEIVEQMLPEGLPAASTILILSDPGAGEKNLLMQFVANRIGDKKPVLYIALDNFPENIHKTVQSSMGPGSMDRSFLIFVDGYSNTVGVESKEEFSVKSDGSLDPITNLLPDILERRSIGLMVLDSLNTIIRKRGGNSALEFLRLLVARTRQAKCVTLVTMNRKAFHPAIVASSADIVEGVIELKVEEGTEGIERFLRIFKMDNAKHSTVWNRYEI